MDKRRLVYAPRASRDLLDLPQKNALQILKDLELLKNIHWPSGKVKKLVGKDYWEIKTGDYRTIFWPDGKDVIILRVVNRKDLARTLGRINLPHLVAWVRSRS